MKNISRKSTIMSLLLSFSYFSYIHRSYKKKKNFFSQQFLFFSTKKKSFLSSGSNKKSFMCVCILFQWCDGNMKKILINISLLFTYIPTQYIYVRLCSHGLRQFISKIFAMESSFFFLFFCFIVCFVCGICSCLWCLYIYTWCIKNVFWNIFSLLFYCYNAPLYVCMFLYWHLFLFYCRFLLLSSFFFLLLSHVYTTHLTFILLEIW